MHMEVFCMVGRGSMGLVSFRLWRQQHNASSFPWLIDQ